MEGDGQSAVLRGRRSDSGLAAGLFPKCFGSLTHPHTEAGEKKIKKDHKECHWAGVEGLDLCQTSMNTGLQQDAGTALLHLPPH